MTEATPISPMNIALGRGLEAKHKQAMISLIEGLYKKVDELSAKIDALSVTETPRKRTAKAGE